MFFIACVNQTCRLRLLRDKGRSFVLVDYKLPVRAVAEMQDGSLLSCLRNSTAEVERQHLYGEPVVETMTCQSSMKIYSRLLKAA